MRDTMNLIKERLEESFSPTYIEITDESHLHTGHAGAQSGKGHYALTIHANAFSGKAPIECHKMIYKALNDLMETHIHALSIKAK